ncbi:hypothetical protein BTO32_00745 [Marinobacter lutaoensis]|uniref:Uncharacterized protein n=1 Tax=Marinobacter lutaoensis TaxID=135739 RepID=A0A1V2DX97_9GAMM|nr:hypothetical protein [Marinobacter lutaoensis]ONF45040.1 hypothetical protein BTO32_00745 [Marinobacter lutaoensis]
MIRIVCLTGALMLVAPTVLAADPEPLPGLVGVSFAKDARAVPRKVLDQQAAKPARGGELSATLYVKTQERLAESFQQPIPDKMVESTRD